MNRTRSIPARAVLAALAVLPAVLAVLAASTGCGGPAVSERRLNVYIWTNYLPDEVVAAFEERTGIEVTVDTYDSNEVLLAKLQSGVADYDVVVPSDYLVGILAPQGLLAELDRGRLPGFEHLDPRLTGREFDPGNRFSVPYLWGTTGIGWDRRAVAGPVESWSVLFDERHAGRILMLDDPREVFGVALRLLGRSINETDPAVLRRAAALLAEQKRRVRTYNSSDFANLLAAGDVDLAHGYNGELAEVVAAHPERFAYAVPKEGGTLWIDSLAIPAGARHPEEAYELLRYVLEPETAARIVAGVHYASANRAARRLVPEEILGNPAIYPPDAVIDRCEVIRDLGETTLLIDQLWTEVKAR